MTGYIPKGPHPQLNRSHIISNGIVGAYPLSEYNSTTIHDVSGNNHHGSIFGGSPVMSKSAYGQALSQGTAGEGIDLGNITDYSFGNGTVDYKMSVMCTFKFNSLASLGALVAKDNSPREWTILVNTNGQLNVFIFDKASDTVRIGRTSPNSTVVAGVWYTAVVTYDASSVSGGIKTYLNGKRVDNADSPSGTYSVTNNKAISTHIGNASSGSLTFNGLMANVVIWRKRCLTQSDISLLYHNPFIMYEQQYGIVDKISPSVASGFGGLLSTQRNRLVYGG